jgi:hypothetical protein
VVLDGARLIPDDIDGIQQGVLGHAQFGRPPPYVPWFAHVYQVPLVTR